MKHNNLFEYATLSYIGATTYVSIEVLYRGYSHWSMLLLGALCFVCMGLTNQVLSWETPLWIQMIIGGSIVSILEFACGCIVNLWLGWHVWDYSHMPLNLLGQISLLSSIGWCFLSIVGIVLDDYIRFWFFGERSPKSKLF